MNFRILHRPSGRADRIRFQDTTSGLIDATVLRIITGDAIVTRMQINGDQGRCLMQIVDTLGDPPGDVNPSLSGVWEQNSPAIILQATGLADLDISGPVATGSDSTDTTEPYSWLPGSLITYTGGLDQWITDFKAAYAADNTLRATMVLDDGVAGPQAHTADAGDVAWAFDIPQPTATRVSTRKTADAGDVAWAFDIPQPTATRVSTRKMGDAGDAAWTFDIPQVSGTRVAAPRAPNPPRNVTLEDIGQTFAFVSWDVPSDDGGSDITGYDVRVGTGAWTDTGTSAREYRIGSLSPGTNYIIIVRAKNATGNSAASVALSITTAEVVVPTVPRHFRAEPTGETGIDLHWDAPQSDGGGALTEYEICVIDEDGTAQPFEPTDDAGTTWRVRGLAIGHRYGFRVRAVNAAGRGPQSPLVYQIPIRTPARVVPEGQRLPLLDVDRQSLIVRLNDIDCRVRVWWQPWDEAWYASIEVPTNTRISEGRRLAVDAGILDRIPSDLGGNVVCRPIGSTDVTLDPKRDAWRVPSHGLVWEPDQA